MEPNIWSLWEIGFFLVWIDWINRTRLPFHINIKFLWIDSWAEGLCPEPQEQLVGRTPGDTKKLACHSDVAQMSTPSKSKCQKVSGFVVDLFLQPGKILYWWCKPRLTFPKWLATPAFWAIGPYQNKRQVLVLMLQFQKSPTIFLLNKSDGGGTSAYLLFSFWNNLSNLLLINRNFQISQLFEFNLFKFYQPLSFTCRVKVIFGKWTMKMYSQYTGPESLLSASPTIETLFVSASSVPQPFLTDVLKENQTLTS